MKADFTPSWCGFCEAMRAVPCHNTRDMEDNFNSDSECRETILKLRIGERQLWATSINPYNAGHGGIADISMRKLRAMRRRRG
jgi:hypothetical protein